MNSVEFTVEWTEKAESLLGQIRDTSLRRRISTRAGRLKTEPVKQGEPLKHALASLYSVPAAQRYLIIYEVKLEDCRVIIHAVGIHRQGDRADIYNVVAQD